MPQNHMSVTQTFYIASSAKNKLGKEAERGDHILRRLVAHANLLDSILKELHDRETEKTQVSVAFQDNSTKTESMLEMRWKNVEDFREDMESDSEDDDNYFSEVEDGEDEDHYLPIITSRPRWLDLVKGANERPSKDSINLERRRHQQSLATVEEESVELNVDTAKDGLVRAVFTFSVPEVRRDKKTSKKSCRDMTQSTPVKAAISARHQPTAIAAR